MRRSAITLTVLLLAGCGSQNSPTPTPARPTPSPAAAAPPVTSKPVPNPPPRVSRPKPSAAPVPQPSGDTCGAKALQSLVGKPRTAIPVPVDVRRRRVTCTTCPVTMDYSAERLNIFFDAQTGIVKEVKCG
ncbi:MAG: peptidase inhibitor I78 [Caulobacteraceae bacterium]|nr:MAG: peptidase inhibitor I78 [Caulobacteraceae bacterium]